MAILDTYTRTITSAFKQPIEKEASVEYVEPNLVKLSDSDFHLEEPWQDIRGFDVYDVDGDKIGTVEDFYVDREAHVTRFLDVKAGGFLGLGKKHFLIPVDEVTRNVSEEDRVTVNHKRDKVLNSPNFDPDLIPDLSFQRTAYAHYGRPDPGGKQHDKDYQRTGSRKEREQRCEGGRGEPSRRGRRSNSQRSEESGKRGGERSSKRSGKRGVEEVAGGFSGPGPKEGRGLWSFSLSRIMYDSRNATKGKVGLCEEDSGAGMLGGEEHLCPVELSS